MLFQLLTLLISAPTWAQTITGTVYTDQGTTNIGAGKTVSISINGAAISGFDDTDAGGVYSVTGLSLNNGDVVTAFLDDEVEDGVTITVVTGAAPVNFDIYQDHLIVRHENNGTFDTSNLSTAFGSGDSDITAVVSNSNPLSVSGSLYIENSFTPNVNISVTADMEIVAGDTTIGNRTLSVTGTFQMQSGARFYRGIDGPAVSFGVVALDNNSTIGYNGGGSGGLMPGAEFGYVFPNLEISGFDAAFETTLPDSDVTINGDFIVARRLFFDDDKSLTVHGDIVVNNLAWFQNTGTGDLTLGGSVSTGGGEARVYFDSAGGGAGDADVIQIRSTMPGVRRNWQGRQLTFIDVDIQDQEVIGGSPNEIYAVDSTDSGNNINWIFDSGISISGQVFLSDRVTNIGAGKTISAAPRGLPAVASAVTDASGNFTLNNIAVSERERYNFYIDDETEDGVTHYRFNTRSSPVGLEIYVDHLTGMGEGGIDVQDGYIDNQGDSDLAAIFTLNGTRGAKIVDGKFLYVPVGETYSMDSGGGIGTSGNAASMVVEGHLAFTNCNTREFYGSIVLSGVFSGNANCTVTTHGDIIVSSGQFDWDLVLAGSNQTINDSSSTYAGITSNGQAKTLTLVGALATSGNFINDQTLTLNGGTLQVEGNFTNSGTIDGSGAVEIVHTADVAFQPGSSFDVDLIVNGTGWVSLNGDLNLTNSDLTLREGGLVSLSRSINAPNTFLIEDGGFFRINTTNSFSPFTTQAGSSVRYDITSGATVPDTVTNFNGELQLIGLVSTVNFPDSNFFIGEDLELWSGANFVFDDDKDISAGEVRIFGSTFTNNGTGDLVLGASGLWSSGTVNFNSSGGSANGGDADTIQIRSATPGVQVSWAGSQNVNLADVDIQDINNTTGTTFYAYSSTDSGNNTNFSFSPPDVAGRVYAADRATPLASRTVSFSVNGGAATTSVVTDVNGFYAVPSFTLSADDVLTAYLDDEVEKGVTVTVSDGSVLAVFDIYQDHLVVRNDNSGWTNRDALDTADNSGDADINAVYTYAWPNLNVTGNLYIQNDFSANIPGVTVSNDFITAAGSLFNINVTYSVAITGSTVFDPTSTIQIFGEPGNNMMSTGLGTTFPNLNFEGSSTSYEVILPDQPITVTGDLSVTNISLLMDDDKDLTVDGSFTMSASGRFLAETSGDLVLGGDVTFHKFQFDGLGGGPGDVDTAQIRSTSPGTRRNWQAAGFFSRFTAYDVDVTDMEVVGGSPVNLYAYSSTDSGNNVNWVFNDGVNISGQAFLSDRATNIGAGKQVSIGLSGQPAVTSAVTDASGNFTLVGVPLTPDEYYLVYFDDEVEDAVTVHRFIGRTPPSSLELYVDHLSTTTDGSGLDDREIREAGDTDIASIVQSAKVQNGKTLFIRSGGSYGMRNGDGAGTSGVTTDVIVDGILGMQFCTTREFYGDVTINGSYSGVTGCDTIVHGDLINNGVTTMNHAITLAGSNQTIDDSVSTFISITSNNQAKTIVVTGTLATSGNFINDQTLALNGGMLQVEGNFTSSGPISGSGTIDLVGATNTTFEPGASFDVDLIVNKTNLFNEVSLSGVNDISLTSGDLIIREGGFNAGTRSVTAPNVFDIESGGQFRVRIDTGNSFSAFSTQAGGSVRYDVNSSTAAPSVVTSFDGSLSFSMFSGSTVTLPDNNFSIGEQLLVVGDGTLVLDDDKDLAANQITTQAAGVIVSTGTGDITIGTGGVSNDGQISLNSSGGSAFGGDVDTIQVRSSVAGVQRNWSGTGTFSLVDVDLQDQNNTTGSAITAISSTDSGSNLNFTFLDSALSAVSVFLADTSATVATNVTVSFSNSNPIPSDGRIALRFPAGFDVSGITSVVSSDLDGAHSINMISGQLLVISRSGGTELAGGSVVNDLVISGIVNPSTPGLTGGFDLSTRDSSDVSIDAGIAPGVAITDAPITGYSVSGKVVLANLDNTALSGMTVTAGSVSTITDTNGNYTLSNAQTGDIVSVVFDGYKLDPSGMDEFSVGSANAADVNFVLSPALTRTSYSGWNTFLGMSAIFELSNNSGTAQVFEVILFDALGQEISRFSTLLASMEKRDFILNDFLGVSDQYGTVQVNSSTTSYLGRVVHYRLNRDIEFAYSVELSGGMQGYSAGGYNAYQPSLNTEDSEYLVSNWVTIINLSSQIQGFQLERYLSDGSEVVDEVYFLPPMGRADIEGGHLVGGGAGINTVQPLDPSVRYLSYTTRYGDIGTEIAGGVTGYYFASSSLMMQPEATKHFLSVGNEVTWLEISNISSSLEEILLEVLALDGTQLFRETFGLPGKTQRHFDVSSVLGAYESGYVKVVTASGHKVVLQSATYEELDAGSIGAMNVSVAADVYGRLVNGAFNTFYDSTNKLRLTNISSDFQDVTITSSYFETIRTRLAPDATEVVDLTFVSDAYGEITVESTTSGSVMAELVRRGNGEFLISSRGR